jgi:SAM-dependent methyltransferase
MRVGRRAGEARMTVTTAPDPDPYSVPGNTRAVAFARFAAPHLRGKLLDVGCGAASVPLYLALHPLELITGLDPEPADHPFTFHQGTAEFLPFPAASFDTVVCAAALDHLPHASHVGDALREIRRVLRPGGRFVSWETTVPIGEPGDEHHLFRFTDGWLFNRFCDFFDPAVIEWQRVGMRRGCAEVFSVWESQV